jgi:hypothetical protein
MADLLRLVAVAALNNQGAKCMRSGDFCLAAGHLRQALEVTRVGIISTEGLDLKMNCSSLLTPHIPNWPLPFTGAPASALRSVDEGLTTTVIEIYDKPLDIAETQTDDELSQDPLFASSMTTGVILFNLALIYHVNGIGSSKNKDLLLGKSRVLYEQALQLLCSTKDTRLTFLAGAPAATCDLIGMAALNNLAQIHHDFGNDLEYISCLNHLILRAASVDTERYGNQELEDAMELLKNTFASNAAAAPFIARPLLGAPAA